MADDNKNLHNIKQVTVHGPEEKPHTHDNVHEAFKPWSEDQTLHMIGMYTNPMRWRTRRKAFNEFAYHMEHSPNVELHVIELAYGDRPFEVTGSRKNDIQLRTKSVLWHKENAINLAVQRFPVNWKYGGYCDGDFHLTRHDWALEAIHMLQHHAFVQLFSTYADLTPASAHSDDGHRPYRMNSTIAWNYTHQVDFRTRKEAALKAGIIKPGVFDEYGYGYGLPTAHAGEFPFGFQPGATGGAWAWTRDAFNTVGGMLDTHIVGGGDWNMALGLIGQVSPASDRRSHSEAYLKAALIWQANAAPLNKNIGCVDCHAVHFFHGMHKNRFYTERWKMLTKYVYDPATDLKRDWQGLYAWSGNKPGLEAELRKYMVDRNEDSTEMTENVLV